MVDHRKAGRPGAVQLTEHSDLKHEVEEEIRSEQAILSRLERPSQGNRARLTLTMLLIVGMVALVYYDHGAFSLMLLSALLLYTFNFVLILIPSTTVKLRPDEKEMVDNIEEERKWLAVKLLVKDRRLAVDIGLTIFLCGILPLSISFSIIFGLTLGLATYLSSIQFLSEQEVWSIFLRVGLILFFYLTVLIIRPQRRRVIKGISHQANRATRAQVDGYSALLILLIIFICVVLATTFLGWGAIFYPGIKWTELSKMASALTSGTAATLLFVLVSLSITMRHFQGMASRRMTRSIVSARLVRLKERVLWPLENEDENTMSKVRLNVIRREFYSMVVFDIGEHDFFGRFQLYLVGPRLRYVLDDRVLNCLK